MKRIHFVFDVESVGLHGEGFSFGWVLVDEAGETIGFHRMACPRYLAFGAPEVEGADRLWIEENVPHFDEQAESVDRLRAVFRKNLAGARIMAKERGAELLIWADCAWPVEARFLIDMVADANAYNAGPYPLHEIATVLLCAGMDPLANYDRLPAELPKHDPLADARQSARLLIDALRKIERRGAGAVE